MVAKTTRAKSVSEFQKALNNLKGGTPVVVASSEDGIEHAEKIPTGILALDKALGGGFPRGKIVELFGPEASGKSAIATMFTGQAQKYGPCVYIDLENALDPEKLENSGVNLDELLLAQPGSGEKTFELLDEIIKIGDAACVVVDSVEGMVTEAELNGDFGDSHVGLKARLMSRGLRVIGAKARAGTINTTLVFVNQLREKIGGFSPTGQVQTTTPGGRALKYWASTRIDVRRAEQIKSGDEVIGHTVKCNVVKSRFHKPFQKAEFDILYDSGISNEATILDEAVKAGFVVKNGSWFAYPGAEKNTAQGRPAMIRHLREHPEEMEALMEKVLETL